MPKLKTKSGAKKRFKITGTGKVMAKCSQSRHLLINKPKRMKRQARGMATLCAADTRLVIKCYLRNG